LSRPRGMNASEHSCVAFRKNQHIGWPCQCRRHVGVMVIALGRFGGGGEPAGLRLWPSGARGRPPLARREAWPSASSEVWPSARRRCWTGPRGVTRARAEGSGSLREPPRQEPSRRAAVLGPPRATTALQSGGATPGPRATSQAVWPAGSGAAAAASSRGHRSRLLLAGGNSGSTGQGVMAAVRRDAGPGRRWRGIRGHRSSGADGRSSQVRGPGMFWLPIACGAGRGAGGEGWSGSPARAAGGTMGEAHSGMRQEERVGACRQRETVRAGGSWRQHVPPDLHERRRGGLKSWYTHKGPSPSLCAAHASESPSPDGDLARAVPVLGP
jgi:hypothetical protein